MLRTEKELSIINLKLYFLHFYNYILFFHVRKQWLSCFVYLTSAHMIFYKDEKAAEVIIYVINDSFDVNVELILFPFNYSLDISHCTELFLCFFSTDNNDGEVFLERFFENFFFNLAGWKCF